MRKPGKPSTLDPDNLYVRHYCDNLSTANQLPTLIGNLVTLGDQMAQTEWTISKYD